ncbi:MAG: glutaminyl-peptide cyclotransferase [Phycisphaerales bacterium]|nr:MAG: glutaminyl-peptide cyclotransferase [Phycisphaerales bacterium]
MNRPLRLSLAAVLALAGGVFIHSCSDSKSSGPAVYTYKISKTYSHDRSAYTQGLAFENGVLYESTGIHGSSTLRKVELETGRVLQRYELPPEYFGEGLTIYGDKIIQLTWRSKVGFVYDKASFELIRRFTYPTEGWGITHDGERLIMSDGTSVLHLLDPETFEETGRVEVHDAGTPVRGLNELEYVKGVIYANVWPTDRIVMIEPGTGRVTGWAYMMGLSSMLSGRRDVDVLNGIAYDSARDRLFITGKRWPKLFEIRFVPLS